MCAYLCPKDAISMEKDTKGFYYPKIDITHCVDCGMCVSVCPIGREELFLNNKSNKCLAVKNKDEIRYLSSSGGIYTAITDTILEKNGLCVGVKYDENFQPIFSIAETELERDEHRGSKYIQPVISTNTLSEIEKLVKLGKYILISGSPCMIAGIKSLFKLRRLDVERVVFVDIVCHGVPSPQMWRDYLDVLEKKYDSKVISYSFRDKTKGWRGYHIRVQFENGLVVEDTDEVNSFVSLFKENLSLRDSCHKCPYTSFSRCGDITIGDFWGIERIDPEFSDNTGISMVFTNSTKGIDIINTIKSKLVYKCYSSRVVIQPNLHKPSEYGLDNKKFWRIYKKKGYLAVINRFSKGGSYYFLYYYKKAIKIRLNRMKNRTN